VGKFLDIWNGTFEGLPQNTEQESLGAGRIRSLKIDIRQRMAQDHSWAGDDSDGYHEAVTLLTQGADPTPTPATGTAGSIYSKTVSGNNELFYQDNNGHVLQITAGGAVNLQGVVTGAMLDFGGTVAPTGYLMCDGSAVSRTTFAALFTAIGTLWGAGDGSTTFNVPDMRRFTSIGSGGAAVSGPGTAVGNKGGAETNTISQGNLPNYNLPVTDPQHAHTIQAIGTPGSFGAAGTGGFGFGPTSSDPTGISVNSGGSGVAINNMQKSAVVLKIIKT
jgi:microcystin-dependent protein